MKYIFHYDQTRKGSEEKFDGWSEHDSLLSVDGKSCLADMSEVNQINTVVAYFEDGNELSVFCDELEEVC